MNYEEIMREFKLFRDQVFQKFADYDEILRTLIASNSAEIVNTFDDENALKVIGLYPEWKNNIGLTVTQKMIDAGQNRFQHNNELYKVVQETVFQEQYEPGAEGTSSIFVKISLEEWPEWVQPTGSHDAYVLGDKVTHNGKKWTSDYDANTWEPGVFGWTEVTE